jgi:hypothetical protein
MQVSPEIMNEDLNDQMGGKQLQAKRIDHGTQKPKLVSAEVSVQYFFEKSCQRQIFFSQEREESELT